MGETFEGHRDCRYGWQDADHGQSDQQRQLKQGQLHFILADWSRRDLIGKRGLRLRLLGRVFRLRLLKWRFRLRLNLPLLSRETFASACRPAQKAGSVVREPASLYSVDVTPGFVRYVTTRVFTCQHSLPDSSLLGDGLAKLSATIA